eukprot:jgi/Tetstr1/424986/TSEL_015456.t1
MYRPHCGLAAAAAGCAMVSPGCSDEDRLLASIDGQISRIEHARALLEPPWDGFCGLVKICDDEAFTTLEQGFIGRPRESRLPSHIANTPDTASVDLSMDWQAEEDGGDQGEGASSSEPGTSAYHQRVAASLSGASRSMAASISGAGSRVVSSLSGSLHAAAEEAGRTASRLLSSRGGREDEAPPGGQPSPSRWKTPWRDASQHGSLAARLSAQLEQAAAQPGGEDAAAEAPLRPPAIANEAFKAAATALEEGRVAEAKELAEVALRGVPSSKPRALAKVHALRARAEAQLQEQAAAARQEPGREGQGQSGPEAAADPGQSAPVPVPPSSGGGGSRRGRLTFSSLRPRSPKKSAAVDLSSGPSRRGGAHPGWCFCAVIERGICAIKAVQGTLAAPDAMCKARADADR